jgi:hypothetical protein
VKRKILRWSITFSSAVCLAHAATIFVGIGNNEFAGDIPVAVTAIQPYAGSITTANNQDQGILTNLNAAAAKLGGFNSADVFIFYYAGHGGTRVDAGDLGDTDHIIGTSTDGGATFPNNPVTDDQLTSAISTINGAHPAAGVLLILDTCFAGQAVADNNDLRSVDAAVIGTADANNCAPGVSKFLPLWQQAFQIVNGDFRADTHNNGTLTLQDLFNFTRNIPNGGENPFGLEFGSNNQNAIVAQIPEPSTFVLLSLGGLGLAIVRLRRRQDVRGRADAI